MILQFLKIVVRRCGKIMYPTFQKFDYSCKRLNQKHALMHVVVLAVRDAAVKKMTIIVQIRNVSCGLITPSV
jgi:hypothetical protein